MSGPAKRFLIVNQHGENRGDEAAMRAMIRAIDGRFPGSSFLVLTQFRDRSLRIRFEAQDVAFETMMLPPAEAAGLAAYAALAAAGLRVRGLLSARARRIVRAYEDADLVITAPGGPYFGDIYMDHELVHWFYVYLARLHRKPVFQYAPSCGPFRIRAMNWLRRRFYRWIDVLVVREEISQQHLQELLGPSAVVHLATDAAIQDEVAPASRDEYFAGTRAHCRQRFIVAVTLQTYGFPGTADPQSSQSRFEDAALKCLEYLGNHTPCHFMFFPQLYGAVHSDVAFHRYMAGRLPAGSSWEMVDPSFDSDRQRALIAIADLCVASRYHPQIFATTQGVPGLFITYEHKQGGYLRAIGLGDYLFDIRAPDVTGMLARLDDLIRSREDVVVRIRTRLPQVRALSRFTTDLLVEFVAGTNMAGVKSIEMLREGTAPPFEGVPAPATPPDRR